MDNDNKTERRNHRLLAYVSVAGGLVAVSVGVLSIVSSLGLHWQSIAVLFIPALAALVATLAAAAGITWRARKSPTQDLSPSSLPVDRESAPALRIRHPRWHYRILPILRLVRENYVPITVMIMVLSIGTGAAAIGYVISQTTVHTSLGSRPPTFTAPLSESFMLILPRAGAPGHYIVTGHVAQNDSHHNLWLVTAIKKGARGSKEENFVRGPVNVDASGRFKFTNLTSGFVVSPGQPWMILLISASSRANNILRERSLNDTHAGHAVGFAKLPPGSRVLSLNSVNAGS